MSDLQRKNRLACLFISSFVAALSGCGALEDLARGAALGAAEEVSGGSSGGRPAAAASPRAAGGKGRSVPGGGPGIALSDAAGSRGGTAVVSATLSTGGKSIAGAQNDLQFDSSVLSIAAAGNGKPDCQVNPAINKTATAFAFTPSGCSGKSCSGVRALVLSLTDVKPIADGSNLYACRVDIAAGAKPGQHRLGNSGVSLSTPAGDAVQGKGVSATISVK